MKFGPLDLFFMFLEYDKKFYKGNFVVIYNVQQT
jgi:hypothetical protein